MNPLEFKSLNANVSAFCKKLTDVELKDLTDFLNYGCYTDKPNKIASEFIADFCGNKGWDANLYDEKEKPQFFNRASMNDKELIKLVRVGLMQECFFRFTRILDGTPYVLPTIKRDVTKMAVKVPLSTLSNIKLSTQDKKTFKEIIKEHSAMLEYQLEDEDSVRKAGGEELVDEKKRHKDFLERFGKSK